jgi:multicomponent K+:H+ antiporter subunit E
MSTERARTSPNAKTGPSPRPSLLARIFPHPSLSVQLALSWLVLSHSLAFVHLLSAALLAWLLPRLLRGFLDDASALHWPSVLRLTGVVLWDIVKSNITVARITLGSFKAIQPAWVPVPLQTDHPRVNALLASIITMTPGTVSAVVYSHRREILVHALSCDDPAALALDIHQRYEAPLLRIFGSECAPHPNAQEASP